MRKVSMIGAILALMTGVSSATVYTWTGVENGDWSNAGNWDANGVPVDFLTEGNYSDGLNFENSSDDIIVFSGSTAPTSEIPGLGGGWNPSSDTPLLDIQSGGTFNFAIVSRESGIWRTSADETDTIWTIGDGVGVNDVTVNVSGLKWLNRNDNATTTDILVNSDGTLILDTDFYFSNTSTRNGKITIAGGDVVLNAKAMDLGQYAADYVDFTEVGGTFTADFGGLMADMDDVTNTYVAAWHDTNGEGLTFTDNLDGSFTVASIPEPATIGMLGLGAAITVLIRRQM